MTKVAICTINWNGRKDTLDFLQSLKKLDTTNLSVKIFLVSNQELKKESPWKGDSLIEQIKKTQNRGSAGGYNDGAKAALKWHAKYILLCGNDILFKDKGLLQDLISVLKSEPNAAIVAPKMYFAPGYEFYRERYSTRDTGHVIWYAGGSFSWANVLSKHRGLDEVDKGQYNSVEETGFTNTTCILVKREIFDQKIFHDEKIFAYFDDNDFLEKVKRAGYKLYYDGRVSIYHKVSRTAGIGSPISDYYTTRNRLIFGLRYAPIRTKLALLRLGLRLLVSGRPMQKRGVIDFLLGARGELHHRTT